MSHPVPNPKRRALLSVSDKSGLLPFARILHDCGFEIVSTGGTFKALEEADIPAVYVEKITQFPECFGGRVKTMHPLILGGVLFNREDPAQVREATELGVTPVDIVVVNLYPFEKVFKRSQENPDSGITNQELVEQIDIGGPTMLRSAAKNFSSVTVVCDPADYDRVAKELASSGNTTPELRRELAGKVFTHTAHYDSLVAEFMTNRTTQGIVLTNGRELRYGENPHQWGKFFDMSRNQKPETRNQKPGWSQLQGKPLSYLNILDSDAAWRMSSDFAEPTAVLVKHANPSGIASHKNIDEAFQRAYDTDRLSAFGVIISLNRECTEVIAKKILDQKIFVEVILAPSFEAGALELLKQKPNIRLLAMDNIQLKENIIYRSAFGGMLVQNDDTREIVEADLKCVTKKRPTKAQINDLLFAWKVVKHAKSNAIVLAKNAMTAGIGCGQTSRVDSTFIALKRAGKNAEGSVLASDAFFPFPDSIIEAAKHGIGAVIQPGGSVRDEEVIKKADELGLAMVVTGVRGFRH
ncbi:MAG: bifunctional phosphoribosylaminoimidazolecarboxamide formyltransferase/IMP cyclohydrolase [Candidatus Peribacteraceae bacterium]|nr:bifunctional phosphoribosylaminoimidazolecarboxamide formyltransferase/IMP cyclohydrolase [Candidatus Peribacteraceae bacterium]